MKPKFKFRSKIQDEEAAQLAKALMSKKAARLYGRMQHGITQKQAKVDNLHKKRREIESTREKSKDGKTTLKLKVERLKKERRGKEDTYAETGGEKNDKYYFIHVLFCTLSKLRCYSFRKHEKEEEKSLSFFIIIVWK